MTDAIERAARVIAESYGCDPDDYAPLATMCTADNQPVVWWRVYEEQAQALFDAGMLNQGWRPISESGPNRRIIVCGWHTIRMNIAGYWWIHEDATDKFGVPRYHPTATFFQPLPTPPVEREG